MNVVTTPRPFDAGHPCQSPPLLAPLPMGMHPDDQMFLDVFAQDLSQSGVSNVPTNAEFRMPGSPSLPPIPQVRMVLPPGLV